MDIPAPGNDALSRRDAAVFLGVSPAVLCQWERRGVGPTVHRLSRKVALYPLAPLQDFYQASRKGPATQDKA